MTVTLPLRFETLDRAAMERRLGRLIAIGAAADVRPWTRENFLADRDEKWTLSFSLQCGEEIVGYVILSRVAYDTVHLHHIAVAKAHRGRGYGAALINEALRRTASRGMSRLSLKVNRSFGRLIAYYVDLGFVLIDKEPEYFRFSRAVTPS